MKVEKEKVFLYMLGSREISKTWMYDILSDKSVYGLEIVCNRSLSMVFFKKVSSFEEARFQGKKLLSLLELKFQGLTGIVEVLRVGDMVCEENFLLYELKLPRLEVKDTTLFPILSKIVHIFKNLYGYTMKFYIIWQRDDSRNYEKLDFKTGDMALYETYKIKLFVMELFKGSSIEDRRGYLEAFKINLEFFICDLISSLRVSGNIIKCSPDYLRKLYKLNVFWKNKMVIQTGVRYADMYRELLPHLMPSFINPNNVDFSFLEILPIPKSIGLSRENLNFINLKGKKRDIILGEYISNGVPTKKAASLSLQSFSQSVIIFGQPGTGKTNLLGHLSKELYLKAKDVGILYLNLGKGNQEHYYFFDRYLKYKDPDLRVPYYIEGNPKYCNKDISETATYVISSLGLKDPVDKVLSNLMHWYKKNLGHLPYDLELLLINLLSWYEVNSYHEEYQTNILRALENRISSLFSNSDYQAISEMKEKFQKGNGDLKSLTKLVFNKALNKTLELKDGFKVPDLFKEWRAGKKIFIDLSMCNIHVKRLVSNAIFQMVRSLIPDMDVESLQNIIVIDEAHQLLEKPIINNPLDDDCIAREQIEKIFNTLLREFRGKGLAFILADQTPHLLFKCVSTLPSLKILFRLDYNSSELFTNNKEELDLITFQKNRQALVLNGVTAERYIIKTFNYTPFVSPHYNNKNEIIKKEEIML